MELCNGKDVEVYAGASALSFDSYFSGAERRILLHAAIYNRFADNPAVSSALETALSRGVQVEVVILPVWRDIVWMDAACHLVRPEGERSDMLIKANVSRELFGCLAKKYPQQLTMYEALTFPALPLVVVDNVILYGQYAHSQVLAPEGFWTKVHAPVELLLSLSEFVKARTEGNAYHSEFEGERERKCFCELTLQERASFRLLQEWTAAKGDVITF
ncbi:hypothetical protein [Halodesulfovibrio marinisediminis]|uniref:Uncharacterized protein n=1 Tax=Halodesulfovibrio marinisediminis DSM 17456 TaxID=1121457 RepID=A0A1N6GLR3_9BACT|nr:hypothetical protein [Halodesulfovibrio marinisediminis]SIO08439.1 hypothetical protein SAMN02745161_1675 [Halodesulfovibrio marinisediminis DSM 17456]